MTRKQNEEKSTNEPSMAPTGDGDTYVTSHRRKTGVGNEPPVLDLREGAKREDKEDEAA